MLNAAAIASALIGILAALLILSNYEILWRQLKAKPGERVPSMIPVAGGLLGLVAMRLSPWGTAPWAWLAPLLDPGCYLVYIVVMKLAGKLKR